MNEEICDLGRAPSDLSFELRLSPSCAYVGQIAHRKSKI
jgi:hypothetical protein